MIEWIPVVRGRRGRARRSGGNDAVYGDTARIESTVTNIIPPQAPGAVRARMPGSRPITDGARSSRDSFESHRSPACM